MGFANRSITDKVTAMVRVAHFFTHDAVITFSLGNGMATPDDVTPVNSSVILIRTLSFNKVSFH